MKVYLADLVQNYVIGDNQISGNEDFVVPLNIANLACYVKTVFKDSLDMTLFKYPQNLMNAIEEGPDIVAMTNYSWSDDLNCVIGAYIKKMKPNTIIVMGGPSIRTDPDGIEKFLSQHPFVDIYVLYEGEEAFEGILRRFQMEGRQFLKKGIDIPGCAMLLDGRLIYHPKKTMTAIEHFPSPYLSGLLDPFLAKGLIPLFETNRGCPFACAFCVWGISALSKIRLFPMDRVMAEMEYVATRFPQHSAWILADANFGMLKRDIEIAKKIRDIRKTTPALQHILTWESKNTSERNFEIAKIMNTNRYNVLMAVQTLDEEAQKAVKRANIGLSHIPQKVEAFHKSGIRVETHVLSGLSGETLEGHLETLKKCFRFGFDLVEVFSTLLLKGSEMETDESRRKYQIQSRYRTRNGAYGEYNGIRSIETEEIIRSNSTITEDEMLSLRGLHWLIWYGWNHGFLKPLLKYLLVEHGLNPADILWDLVRDTQSQEPLLAAMFKNFFQDAEKEWFDSPHDLKRYYTDPSRWKNLLQYGYSKVEFRYNAKMIMDRALYLELLGWFSNRFSSEKGFPKTSAIAKMLSELRIEVEDYIRSQVSSDKTVFIPQNIQKYMVDFLGETTHGRSRYVTLRKTADEKALVLNLLKKFKYDQNPQFGIEKTLGAAPDAFMYEVVYTGTTLKEDTVLEPVGKMTS